MAKVKVTAPNADTQDRIASVIPVIRPSTMARIMTEAEFCAVIAGISPMAFIREISKIGSIIRRRVQRVPGVTHKCNAG